jgi:hypothetical protein
MTRKGYKKGPEATFQDDIAEHARERGWLVMAISPGAVRKHRFITNMRYDGDGWPDLTCTRDGRMVIIECKARGIRALRPRQEIWRDQLLEVVKMNNGIEYHVLNPIDWDKIERIFA